MVARTLAAAAATAAGGVAAAMLLVDPAGPGDRPLPVLEGPPARIVAFGTSLTARNPWPRELGERLSGCLGSPVEVVRVAAVGEGSAWALDQVQTVVDADPDLVLIEFSINDADVLDGVSLRTSRDQHARLIAALRGALGDVPLVLLTMSPVRGIVQRLKRPRLAAYYRLYGDLADARELGLVDLHERWTARRGAFEAPDGLHPTALATRAVVVPALEDAVLEAAGAPGCG